MKIDQLERRIEIERQAELERRKIKTAARMIIGYEIVVGSMNPKRSGKKYRVFFGPQCRTGMCSCPWMFNTDGPRPQCEHIRLAAASIYIDPRVAVPVYQKRS